MGKQKKASETMTYFFCNCSFYPNFPNWQVPKTKQQRPWKGKKMRRSRAQAAAMQHTKCFGLEDEVTPHTSWLIHQSQADAGDSVNILLHATLVMALT